MKSKGTSTLLGIAILLVSAMLFTSCKDSDETPSPTPEYDEPTADYTVIFWGMSGGCESATFSDLLEMQQMREDGRINADKVNFYGLLKTSNKIGAQDSLKPYGYDGTLLLDLGHATGTRLQPDTLTLTPEEYPADYAQCSDILREFNAQPYADKKYPLNNVDSLANFIKQAVAKYPAKKYILLMYGHGSGFDPREEVANADAYTTRGCVYDDLNGSKSMTADNLVAAVRNSGVDISMIFFQCCLMATLENIAAYQHCTHYIMASDEVTYGGYMQNFVANISQAGSSDAALEEASKTTIDYYVEKYADATDYTSHGIYDLSKTKSLLSTVRDISSWYTDAFDRDSTFINQSAAQATICADLGTLAGSKYLKMRSDVSQVLVGISMGFEYTDEELLDFCNNLKIILNLPVCYGFVFSSLMKETLDNQAFATGTGLDFTRLQSLYNQYMTQLKDMAYIRSIHENKAVTDYNYLLASPTVNIFTMNAEGFHPTNAWKYMRGGSEQTTTSHMLDAKLDLFIQAILDKDEATQDALFYELFNGCYFARFFTLENIEVNYTATQFDQATGWSNFLRKLSQNPTYLTNPGRIDYVAD